MKHHPKTDTVTHEELYNVAQTSEARSVLLLVVFIAVYIFGIITGAILT